MKVVVDVKALTKAIGHVTGLTKNANVRLTSAKGGEVVGVAGSGNGVVVSLNVEATVEAPGHADVDSSLLLSVLKGRTKVSLEKSGSKFKFSEIGGRKYKGDVAMTEALDVSFGTAAANEKSIKIGKEACKVLDTAIKAIALNNLYTDAPMYVWVLSGKDGLTVMCFDDYHLAFFRDTSTTMGKLEFQLSLQTFQILNKLSDGQPYRLELDEGTLTAYNSTFRASMPLTQDSTGMTAGNVKGYLKNLKADGYFFIDHDEFEVLLTNSLGAYKDRNTPLTIRSVAKNQLEFAVNSSLAKIAETLNTKHQLTKSLNCNPSLMLDVLNALKSGGKVAKMKVDVSGNTLVIRQDRETSTTVYACQLL